MSKDHVRAAMAAVDQDADFVVDLTREMVRIPTVNPKFVEDSEVNREPDHQIYLEGVMKEVGLETEQTDAIPNRPNLTGIWGGTEDRSLIISGHVDVVPEGDRGLWTTDPYGAEIKDGRMYGRGTIDMKGGIAAGVAACKAIRKAGIELEGRFEIHAVVDEEAGGFGAMDLIRRGHTAKAAIVAETTAGAVAPAESGLEWVKVTIRGKTAHAGRRYNTIYPQRFGPTRPAPGVNAIEIGARFLQAVRELEREWGARKQHPLLPPGITTINPGVIIGGAGMGADGRPLVTTNAAIIPDVCIMEFDLKFLPNEKSVEVRREFETFVHHFAQTDGWLRENPPAVEWEVRGLHLPPVDTPIDHALVQSIVSARTVLGLETQMRGYTEVCDAAHYAGAGATCVIYGPSGDRLHGIDEYVEIESLVECAKVFAGTIIEWCGVR